MKKRLLADQFEVSTIGLGCMGMNWGYGATTHDREEALATIRHALDIGVNFLDTADAYGPYTNEELVAEAIKGRREEVVLATKFGLVRGLENKPGMSGINGTPQHVKESCEGSLKRLKTDRIDLYYYHRLDPQVPIEETVGAMKDLVQEGKVRAIGLSEMSAATIHRAYKVHPIAALQSEYSLWARDVEENGVFAALRELSIGFVPYAPLGRGFLTGAIRSIDDFAPDDYRRISPRFQGDNFKKNFDIVDLIKKQAKQRGVTPAQLALAWVLAQGDHIVPIPGTRHIARLDENSKAVDIVLSNSERDAISSILPKAQGERYPASTMGEIDH